MSMLLLLVIEFLMATIMLLLLRHVYNILREVCIRYLSISSHKNIYNNSLALNVKSIVKFLTKVDDQCWGCEQFQTSDVSSLEFTWIILENRYFPPWNLLEVFLKIDILDVQQKLRNTSVKETIFSSFLGLRCLSNMGFPTKVYSG